MAGPVHLLLGSAFDDTWREVAQPWLSRAARSALTAEDPWVVLSPSRAWSHALKARLVAEGLHLGGVFFWTPGELRDHVRRRLPDPPAIAVREHLHLLLAATADRADAGPARAAAREPARLLRSLDQLIAAGLDARALDFPPAEQLAARFQEALRDAHWTTVQAFDWELAKGRPPATMARLLMLGFDAAHWDLWPLLHAAARSAREATVVLTAPRTKAEQLDQAWIGTWEQAFGPAEHLAVAEGEAPYAPLARRMESAESDGGRQEPAPIDVLIGRNVQQQAEAIVAQGIAYLARPDATRVGVLFPGPGPLCREVSAQLLQRGIPHFNAFGHTAPPPASALRWRAWNALQRSYRLEPLLRLLELDPSAAPPAGFLRAVDRAYGDVLVDDLPVIATRLHDQGHPDALDAARFIARFARLPATGAFADLRDATRAAWQDLGWTDLVSELDAQAMSLAALAGHALSVASWLDWLDSVAPAPAQERETDASNPLASLHLLAYTQAEGLPWSHLILADLNEGRWPPSFDPAGFLNDDRIAEINRDALTQGSQGEGHVTAKPGRALLLGTSERRELHRRQFYNLVESASAGLAVACALESEEASGRILPASDFLSHLYFTALGEPLTEQRMEDVQRATSRWLERVPPPPHIEPPAQPSPVAQVPRAYEARRSDKPFGSYECAFVDGPPPKPASLSCKQWELAVWQPSSLWFSTYLGVQPADAFGGEDRWPVTRGTWVHRWLARALCDGLGRFEPRARGADIAVRVRKAVHATHISIAHAFAGAGRGEPQWWQARLAHAEWMALQFARRLAALPDWPVAAAEWTLPKTSFVQGAAGRLDLRGRIDALLAQAACKGIPEVCWVADFKTGNERPLTGKNLGDRLLNGFGVQICLYGLALASAGARDVSVSLLTPEADVVPQVDLAAMREQQAVWDELVRMQDTGIFGMRGRMRAEYGPSLELPLATLPVDPEKLEEKWGITHPGLAAKEERDEA